MLAIHDQFANQMHYRLKTFGMGLGLVRLLQDAGRVEEATMTLSSLENGFQGNAEESDTPIPKPYKVNRLKGVSRSSFKVRSMNLRNELIETLTSASTAFCSTVPSN